MYFDTCYKNNRSKFHGFISIRPDFFGLFSFVFVFCSLFQIGNHFILVINCLREQYSNKNGPDDVYLPGRYHQIMYISLHPQSELCKINE